MTKPERRNAELVFGNQWIEVYRYDVHLAPETEVLECFVVGQGRPCVAVLPIDGAGVVTLVRQYRFAVDAEVLSLPGGGVDPGEDLVAAARRELAEETGLRCGRIEPLLVRYLDSGQKDAEQHVFVATELTPGEQDLDPTERITVERHHIDDLAAQILAGEHRESSLMTAVLIYLARGVAR